MAKFGIALGSGPRGLGFESRYSDQNSGNGFCHSQNFYRCYEIRKDGASAHTGVKKCQVDTFLVHGRILWFLDAPLVGVDRNQICSIFAPHNYTPYPVV